MHLLLKLLRLIYVKWTIAFWLIWKIFFSFYLFNSLSFICNHFISIFIQISFRNFSFFIIFFHNYVNRFFRRPNFSYISMLVYINFIFIMLHFPHILIVVNTWVWNIFLFFFCKVELFLCYSEVRIWCVCKIFAWTLLLLLVPWNYIMDQIIIL